MLPITVKAPEKIQNHLQNDLVKSINKTPQRTLYPKIQNSHRCLINMTVAMRIQTTKNKLGNISEKDHTKWEIIHPQTPQVLMTQMILPIANPAFFVEE